MAYIPLNGKMNVKRKVVVDVISGTLVKIGDTVSPVNTVNIDSVYTVKK